MYCVDQMAPIEMVVADRWAVVAITDTTNKTDNMNFYSFGTAYNISEDFSATFDYTKMQHSTVYEVDVKKITIGIRYNF
jgi:hypothetical protein